MRVDATTAGPSILGACSPWQQVQPVTAGHSNVQSHTVSIHSHRCDPWGDGSELLWVSYTSDSRGDLRQKYPASYS